MMLLIAQVIAMAPVPAEMNPALERYGDCLHDRIEGSKAEIARRPRGAQDVIVRIQATCAPVRAAAIAAADDALTSHPTYQNKAARRAFVADRFDERDAYLLSMFDGSAFAGKVDK